jgi:hypothetical protein
MIIGSIPLTGCRRNAVANRMPEPFEFEAHELLADDAPFVAIVECAVISGELSASSKN